MNMSPLDEKQYDFRVLAGRYAGHRMTFDGSLQKLSIGYDLANDIVLRIGQIKDVKLIVDLSQPVPTIYVASGAVTILGQTLTAGQSMLLPDCTPVQLGEEILAFALCGSDAWETCAALIRLPLKVPAVNTKLSPPSFLDTIMHLLPERNILRAHPWLAGIAAVLILGAMTAPNIDIGRWIMHDTSSNQVRSALERAGLSQLSVHQEGGMMVVRGFVTSNAEAQRIRHALKSIALPVRIDVQNGATLAQSVSDVLRIQGVHGGARYIGNGTVEINAPSLQPALLAAVEKNAKHDIPGLKAIHFRQNTDQSFAGMNGLANATANPGKRIAALVAGESGYITTADGGRYFTGALLPTGHKVLSIEGRQVMLEHNGAVMRWLF